MYIVGGAVRDYYLGVMSKDVDYVVVGATPEDMEAAGYSQVGASFPVFLDDNGTEYALARTERKTGDGYHGFVTDFSTEVTLEQDLLRRDLTVNAMAQEIDGGELIDPYNGLADLQAKLLRHVSPAFAEDPVRVLRLGRFMSRFGPEWSIAPETLQFCKEMVAAGSLDHLTPSRVLKELERVLAEPYPQIFFDVLDSVGALEVVFPGICIPVTNSGYEFVETTGSVKLNFIMFLCSLSSTPEELQNKLGVPNDWKQYVTMYERFKFDYIEPTKDIVSGLYDCDAYRQETTWKELVNDCITAATHNYYSPDTIKVLTQYITIFEKTKKIGFNDLTPEQQATLKGPEIAAAIRKLRESVK